MKLNLLKTLYGFIYRAWSFLKVPRGNPFKCTLNIILSPIENSYYCLCKFDMLIVIIAKYYLLNIIMQIMQMFCKWLNWGTRLFTYEKKVYRFSMHIAGNGLEWIQTSRPIDLTHIQTLLQARPSPMLSSICLLDSRANTQSFNLRPLFDCHCEW